MSRQYNHSEDLVTNSAALIGGKLVLVIDSADAVVVRSALNRQALITEWSGNREPLERIRDDIGKALGMTNPIELENWNTIDSSLVSSQEKHAS